MNELMESRFGRALYEALPEIYRTRDGQRARGEHDDNDEHDDNGEGHLAAYLDSCGKLLDAVYNSLDQRYRDCFPETCQEWLLPYFAELLDASTLSPHVEGRRREIMHAVAWRQGKGSLTTVKDIAEKVGGFEKLAVREGWQRLARTARVGGQFTTPVTANPRGKTSLDFTGHRNTAPHSVDVRKPGRRHGHANQRAVLLYASPFPGFFAGEDAVTFKWKNKTVNGSETDIDTWFEKGSGTVRPGEYIGLEFDKETQTWSFFKKPGVTKIINITGDKTLKAAASPNQPFQYRFTELNLNGLLTVTNGTRLAFEKLAAREVSIVGTADKNKPPSIPTFTAENCLLKGISAKSSLTRLVYCTVLGESLTDYLEASDCIFTETLYEGTRLHPPRGDNGIRYCRHGQEARFGNFVGNTTEKPVFYTGEWDMPGCGVLHPASPKSICNGAEDGGEMGAYHHRAYAAAWDAVTRKLLDYLPAGMSAALIPDETLYKNI